MTQRPNVSPRLFERWKTIDNRTFLAFMERPEFSNQARNYSNRVLHVKLPTIIKLGEVVKAQDTGEIFILGKFQSTYPKCEAFKAYPVDAVYSWKRKEKSLDLVTKFVVFGEEKIIGDIYTSIEPLKEEKFSGFSERTHHLVTSQKVEAGDGIGNRVVKSVDEDHGLYYVVLQPK